MTHPPALPRCLSVRQPWAHHIMWDGKDIENRVWRTAYRGPLLIHASAGVDKADLHEVAKRRMPLGAIVGLVDVVDCVDTSDSHWWLGPYGLVVASPRPIKAVACKGTIAPKLFEVPADAQAAVRAALDQLGFFAPSA